MPTIYHIASASDWHAARAANAAYTVSTRGRSLAEVGFIHASDAAQVAPVANAFYAGDEGLVVLAIDTAHLTSELKYEPVPGSDAPFPHIYGPLDLDAVTAVLPLSTGPDGTFRFPA